MENIKMDFKKRIWDAINIMKKKYNYTPKILISMMNKHGVVEAVRRLINSPEISDGYTKLWKLKALDLSMEAIILEEEWESLFSEQDRIKARDRLNKYGFHNADLGNKEK